MMIMVNIVPAKHQYVNMVFVNILVSQSTTVTSQAEPHRAATAI